jgi:DNA polymerase type B, organellar and viral
MDALIFTNKKSFKNTAFEINYAVTESFVNIPVIDFMRHVSVFIESEIYGYMEEDKSLKIRLLANVNITENIPNITEDSQLHVISSRFITVRAAYEVKDAIIKLIDQMQTNFEHAKLEHSGWVFKGNCSIQLGICSIDPLNTTSNASRQGDLERNQSFSGSSYVQLPKFIEDKKAIVNVRNTNDEFCFKWAVLSALDPQKKHSERLNKWYSKYREIDFSGIEFPVKLQDITMFENKNYNISITVLGFATNTDENTLKFNLLRTPQSVKNKHIWLLLERDTDTSSGHYSWIKNISRLLSSITVKRKITLHYCAMCLGHFDTESKLKQHYKTCHGGEPEVILPTQDNNIVKFKSFMKQVYHSHVIYADFECLLEKNNNNSKIIEDHVPCSFGYCLKTANSHDVPKVKLYRGKNAAQMFISEIENEAEKLNNVINNPEPIVMTSEDIIHYSSTNICWMCEFQIKEGEKVRDHDHFSGKYRGPACKGCNFKYQNARKLYVFMHNSSRYDNHLIIKYLKVHENTRIEIVPRTSEQYIAIIKTMYFKNAEGKKSKVITYFLDSMNFLQSSLSHLATLQRVEDMTSFTSTFPEHQLKFVLGKMNFPYKYFTSWDKFETTTLPPTQYFSTREDYMFARQVWTEFEIGNNGEFMDLYLKIDVMLLCDIFETFRKQCLIDYKLDPVHYMSLPGFTYDAALKMTKVELLLITEKDIMADIESGMRGGVCMITKRFAQANNYYMGDKYDPSQESSYIMQFDVNALYSHIMRSYKLPIGDFKYVEMEHLAEIDLNFINNLSADSDYCFIFVVDLEYPEILHDAHNDYPLISHKEVVQEQWLSPYSLKYSSCDERKHDKSMKLLSTYYPKQEYVVHYMLLKYWLFKGVKITKIHRVMYCRQSYWLKEYIDFNCSKRSEATNKFLQDLYKLIMNSFYGKTCENVRNQRILKIYHDSKSFQKDILKENIIKEKIYNDDLAMIEFRKLTVQLNKPIFIGFTILDLSKLHMQQMWYDKLKIMYDERIQLLGTDTDSFIIHIKTKDVYTDMQTKDFIGLLDTSNFAPNNIYGIPQRNHKVTGLIKDEMGGNIIEEFVGLRAKCYSTKQLCGKEVHKHKGVPNIINASHEQYKSVLMDQVSQSWEYELIRQSGHDIQTILQQKVALSGNDTKRYISDDGIHTLPYGHFKIRNS